MLTKENKQKIAKKLVEKIGMFKCPICQNGTFAIADGFVANSLQHDFKNLQMGGEYLPSIILVCKKCGFTSFHNTNILGIEDAELK